MVNVIPLPPGFTDLQYYFTHFKRSDLVLEHISVRLKAERVCLTYG